MTTTPPTNDRSPMAVIEAFVPLNNMFGYSTELRSITQGKGEFSMEYAHHAIVSPDVQSELTSNYERKRSG